MLQEDDSSVGGSPVVGSTEGSPVVGSTERNSVGTLAERSAVNGPTDGDSVAWGLLLFSSIIVGEVGGVGATSVGLNRR